MLTVAYLANQFPCVTESYVGDEVEELRRRGVRVIVGSVQKPPSPPSTSAANRRDPEIVIRSATLIYVIRALWLCIKRCSRLSDLLFRVFFKGTEGPALRMKALLHTFLGACYAVMLEDEHVDHIHVHHGYCGSWIGMVAARLLAVDFSFTLHGSDLLLHGVYLDVKLASSTFCLTISYYNRQHILRQYPKIDPAKVVVARLGVEVETNPPRSLRRERNRRFTMLAVGRLHPVKNHEFLIRACAQLHARGFDFECLIAGEGPTRARLQSLIESFALHDQVLLLGGVSREQVFGLYDRADLVVLTSRSEGIPLVLMEAMARAKLVLAPAITGIPELVLHGKTGFLYEPGSLKSFLAQFEFIQSLLQESPSTRTVRPSGSLKTLDWIRHAAYVQVRHNFNRKTALESFAHIFLSRVTPREEKLPHENLVLQQI